MLKPLAIGLLALSATCATAAFAHGHNDNKYYNDNNDWSNYQHDFDKNGDDDKYWKDGDNDWQDDNQDWKDGSKCGKGDHDHHPASAPEIDPAGATGALTLLFGGLAALRGRRSARPAA
jgi:hypothetical protein